MIACDVTASECSDLFPDLDTRQKIVIDALEDIKAVDIRVFDTRGISDQFDRVIIASGNTNRQTKALASSVRAKVKAHHGEIISTEGEATGEWILIDLGDMVVHIMQPLIREYYRLEEVWGDQPMRVNLLSLSPQSLVK
jgi:ribosome-associated protein